MNILVIGSGGREHTLVWKTAQNPKISNIFCIPGNAGISTLAKCVDIDITNINKILAFALEQKIDLTIVGPELPLTLGIVDTFETEKLKIFGPVKKAAALEGSKVFAKEFMKKSGIPTADFEIFDNFADAENYLKSTHYPIVIKADGLAAGKGVKIASSYQDAYQFLEDIMIKKIFGESGSKVIIEECLEGEEVSIMAIADEETIVPLLPSQDHKRVFDNDKGPNTGGMGAYAPLSIINEELLDEIRNKILIPTIRKLSTEEGINYKGVLYAGLMLTKDGPKVLEYNVRFGDPETQVVVPLIVSDIIEICDAVCENRLKNTEIKFHNNSAVCVVLASGGYPGKFEKNKEIFGLNKFEETVTGLKTLTTGASYMDNIIIFHAGTAMNNDKFYTSGGRVLGITAKGNNIKDAVKSAYNAIDKIKFDGMHFRKDIAQREIKRFTKEVVAKIS